jgi:L-amino acid N-acyltransferase YncA
LIFDVGRWQVPKKNSKKHFEMWSEWMDYIRKNRNKFHFAHSRLFILETKDSAVEAWMFVDEYEDQKAYDKTMKAMQTDKKIVGVKSKVYKDFESLCVPNSFKTEVWIEKPELSVSS